MVVHKEGYLRKQSPAGLVKLKPWQKRWFILEDDDLLYYEDQNTEEPLGLIPLEIASSIKLIKKSHGHCVEIIVSFYIGKKEGERRYNLQAENYKEAESWVTALRERRRIIRDKPTRRQTVLVDREVDPTGEEKGDGSAEVEVDPDAEYDEDEEGVPFVDEEKEEEGDELVEDEGEEEVEEEVEEVVRMPVPVGVGGGVEHFTNLTISKNKKSRGMKALVSKKKRRFVQDGFDLDLTYITDQIIAMGFPAEGAEALYRNSLSDVYRFFETRHKDHYKIYNLCSERSYDHSKFNNMVEVFPFDDHNAPPFEMMFSFCDNVSNWLAQSPRNVAAIHCKAGKGRTGVMICAYLLHSRAWKSATEVMSYYGMVRTHDLKGVTIASQKRYIQYYADVLETGPKLSCCLYLKKFKLRTIPYGKCRPWIKIENGSQTIKSMQLRNEELKEYTLRNTPQNEIEIDCSTTSGDLENGIPLVGDVRITGYHKKGLGGDEKMFQFWFHTSFVKNNHLIVMKSELDKACKDKKHKDFEKVFGVELFFQPNSSWVDEEEHVPGSGIVAPQKRTRKTSVKMRKSEAQVAQAVAAKSAAVQSAIDAVKATRGADGSVSVQAVRKASRKPEVTDNAPPFAPLSAADDSTSSASSPSKVNNKPRKSEDEPPIPGVRMTSPTLVRAIYNYEPQEKNHLPLRKDDIVTVIQKTDSGWSLGKCGANIGWFPQRYVVVLDTHVPK